MVNILHVLVLLGLLFQGIHQYVLFRGSLISLIHAIVVEQKLVFQSNIQVFGSTSDLYGSNQYQHDIGI